MSTIEETTSVLKTVTLSSFQLDCLEKLKEESKQTRQLAEKISEIYKNLVSGYLGVKAKHLYVVGIDKETGILMYEDFSPQQPKQRRKGQRRERTRRGKR